MGLSRCPFPLRLVDPNEEEEEPEGIDNNQFLQQLSGMTITPARTKLSLAHSVGIRENVNCWIFSVLFV